MLNNYQLLFGHFVLNPINKINNFGYRFNLEFNK